LQLQEADARRGHRGSRDRLHYVRDAMPGEYGRMRKVSAPLLLAAVRNLVIHSLTGVVAQLPGFGRRFRPREEPPNGRTTDNGSFTVSCELSFVFRMPPMTSALTHRA
jgi:hypothetical protein